MVLVQESQETAFSRRVLQAFENVNGSHPGFRPAHAKGILLSGVFKPSPMGVALTRAPHVQQAVTPVTVRFSDFAGMPNVPDNHPNASPRGIAIRFHLGEHAHTDITAHSVDAFPARTADEFVEFLNAAAASGPAASKPTPIESFLATHPAALRFVQLPKPFPTSFAKECFYSVNAYRFIDINGVSQYGRYRIRPDKGSEYLDAEAAAAKAPNYLFDELRHKLGAGAIKIHIVVQLAAAGDVVDDSTVAWPEERPEAELGTIELTGEIANNDTEQRRIIFDPIPRVDGIEASADPLLQRRADVYLMSGRRRRTAGAAA